MKKGIVRRGPKPPRSDYRRQTKLKLVKRANRQKPGGSLHDFNHKAQLKSNNSFIHKIKIPFEETYKTQYRKFAIGKVPVQIPFRDAEGKPRNGITKDVFMNRIGKGCAEHADKIASWEELMKIRSVELKKREVPVKQRRWILRWVEKYKQGYEPHPIRFKSICKKNKEKRAEMQEKHKENFAKHLARKEQLKAQRKEEKKAWLAKIHALDTERKKQRVMDEQARQLAMQQAKEQAMQQPNA